MKIVKYFVIVSRMPGQIKPFLKNGCKKSGIEYQSKESSF